MPYRRPGEALAIPTMEGPLSVTIAADCAELRVADRGVLITRATVVTADEVIPRTGAVVVTRNATHGDLAIWIESGATMRRVFGVAPVSMHAPEVAACVQRIRAAIRGDAGIVRSVELGRGLDPHKVLLTEHAGCHRVFACRLFRSVARLVMTVHHDGRIVFEQSEIRVDRTTAIDVHRDELRFRAGREGVARVALPWLAAEDRAELARRIGAVLAAA